MEKRNGPVSRPASHVQEFRPVRDRKFNSWRKGGYVNENRVVFVFVIQTNHGVIVLVWIIPWLRASGAGCKSWEIV
jgi:hypothetical protein